MYAYCKKSVGKRLAHAIIKSLIGIKKNSILTKDNFMKNYEEKEMSKQEKIKI